jgi:hypothetical protein
MRVNKTVDRLYHTPGYDHRTNVIDASTILVGKSQTSVRPANNCCRSLCNLYHLTFT